MPPIGCSTSMTTARAGGGETRILTLFYDALGRRTTMNPASSFLYYQYDPVSRLHIQTQHFAGTPGGDTTDTLGYNPASQITSEARTNNAFVYAPSGAVSQSYTVNGLNQYTSAGGAALDLRRRRRPLLGRLDHLWLRRREPADLRHRRQDRDPGVRSPRPAVEHGRRAGELDDPLPPRWR